MNDYGAKISTEEYNRRTTALNTHPPEGSSKERKERKERKEALGRGHLDIMIDHKLGTSFPDQKRDRLWNIQRKFDQQKGWCIIKNMVTHPFNPLGSMSHDLVRAYSAVLSPEELQDYFGYSASDLVKIL